MRGENKSINQQIILELSIFEMSISVKPLLNTIRFNHQLFQHVNPPILTAHLILSHFLQALSKN